MKIRKILLVGLIFILTSCYSPTVPSDSSTSFSPSTSDTSDEPKPFFTDDVQFETMPNETKISLTYSSFNNIGTYETGNYVNRYSRSIYKIDGVDFEFYRATRAEDETYMFNLLPYFANNSDGTISGAFYNTNRISDINRVIIEYKNNTNINSGFAFSYSSDNLNYSSELAPSSNEFKYIQANCDKSSYFKIEANNQIVCINKVYIFYSGNISDRQSYSSGINLTRLNSDIYQGKLVEGESYIDTPRKVIINDDGTYKITETKKLIYYTTDYVMDHPEIAETASITDPIDVASYVAAFKINPANYIKSGQSITKYYEVFQNKLRYYFLYSRTDGYVNSVPVDKDNIEYYEYDIDIGNTYISPDTHNIKRGVGRVVVFMNGFTSDSYNDSPIAVYTDDHYSTFQEYLNNGLFSNRFFGQSYRNGFNYGSAKTLNPVLN